MAVGDGGCEAYAAMASGWAIELRKPEDRGGRGGKQRRRRPVRRRHARRCRPAAVEDPITRKQTTPEPGRSHVRPGGFAPRRSALGRRGTVADDERTGEVRPRHRSVEGDERSRATGSRSRRSQGRGPRETRTRAARSERRVGKARHTACTGYGERQGKGRRRSSPRSCTPSTSLRSKRRSSS